MNNELSETEKCSIGKQQLMIKTQLAQRENLLIAKQQLLVKAGLAKKAAEQQ